MFCLRSGLAMFLPRLWREVLRLLLVVGRVISSLMEVAVDAVEVVVDEGANDE
jgi:hypothetical protein